MTAKPGSSSSATRARRRVFAGLGVLAMTATVVVGASTGVAVADGSAGASASPARTWGTNGRVSAILNTPSGVILGGDFTAVVDTNGRSFPVGRLAKYLPSTGTFDTTWTPAVDAPVDALAVSGDQLFVGGAFTKAAGIARKALVAFSLSNGALDRTFLASTDREVDGLTVAGSSLILAGNFTKVTDSSGTTARANVAKVSLPTGALDRSWTPVLNARARAVLATPDGSQVYVGGDFTSTNGFGYAAKLTLLSVASAAIDPTFRSGATNQTTKAPVFALVRSGSALLAGVAGSGGACARLDAATGAVRWSKHATGDVQSIAVFGPYTYCGGHFSGSASFDGLDREKLAAVDTASGAVQPFAPIINSALGLWSLGSTPDALILGGDFTKINTVLQSGVAQLRDTTAITAPAAPAGLLAAAGDSTVTLTWGVPSTDGGSQPVTYRVYRSVAGSTWTQIGTAAQENFTDTTATNGTTYTYAVLARTTVGGDSSLSATAQATPDATTAAVPGVPSSFRATGAYQAAQLSWEAPSFAGSSPITTYRVLRSTTSGQEQPLVDLPASARSYTDTDIVTQTRYYYTVQAVNAVGAGAPTTEEAAVPSSGVPNAPDLTGSPNGAAVSLSWTISSEGGSPVQKYIVVRNGIRIGIVTPPSMTLVDTDPPSGTNTYMVRAVNSIGTSRWSNSVVFTAP